MAYDSRFEKRRAYREEDIAIARDTDLVAVASALGYHPRRIGRFYDLEEHDSLRIFPDNTYCRFSSLVDGKRETGTAIDFAMRYGNMEFKEAMTWLLEFHGKYLTEGLDAPETVQRREWRKELKERKEFVLPERNENNRRMYAYLCKTRGIPYELVKELWQKGLIYESKERHNVVFVSYDAEGKARHAFQRGTYGNFKNDVEGSEKESFCFTIPASGAYTDTVCVYEAAIDAISACALDRMDHCTGNGEPWRLAMGMLSDNPLEKFLVRHPEVKRIVFGFDLDVKGREAVNGTTGSPGLIQKWRKAGYDVIDCPAALPEGQGKDFNDLLLLRVRNGQNSGEPGERPEESRKRQDAQQRRR